MLDYLLALSPAQFEKLVASLLEAQGYEGVQVIGGANDRGVDIVCRDTDGSLIAIQCKRYNPNRRVGALAIQHLSAMAFQRRAHRGIFVSTATFTNSARAQAEEFDIELVDGAELIRLLAEYDVLINDGECDDTEPPVDDDSRSQRCLRDSLGFGLETPFVRHSPGAKDWRAEQLVGPDRPVTVRRKEPTRSTLHELLVDASRGNRILEHLTLVSPTQFRQAIAIRLLLARRETEGVRHPSGIVFRRSIERSEEELETIRIYMPSFPNSSILDFFIEYTNDGGMFHEVHRCHWLEQRQVVKAADIDEFRSFYQPQFGEETMHYYTNSYYSWSALQSCETGSPLLLEDADSIAYDLFMPFPRDFSTLSGLSPLSQPHNLIYDSE